MVYLHSNFKRIYVKKHFKPYMFVFFFVFQSFLNAFDINRAPVVSLRLQSSGVWVRVFWHMSTNISEEAVSCMLGQKKRVT